MNERKVLLFILSLVIYCLYSGQMWFAKDVPEVENTESQHITAEDIKIEPAVYNNTVEETPKIKAKVIPLYMKNACSILQVFTEKPSSVIKCKDKPQEEKPDTNKISMFGIAVFLVILMVNAVLDVLKVKEEERARRKLNPDGERRQSLAEFANKKPLRRESSRFGLQLFQIAEAESNPTEDKTNRRETRKYTRGDSTNSYLSDKKPQSEGSAPASIGETSEPKLVKRQSVAKLFGARPVPMVRRSSFPALPLNPDVQAAMLGHRQPSVDSDDEGDGRHRRVRLIRRF